MTFHEAGNPAINEKCCASYSLKYTNYVKTIQVFLNFRYCINPFVPSLSNSRYMFYIALFHIGIKGLILNVTAW